MNKIKNLQEKEKVFRELLELYASEDSDAETLLSWLLPLFLEIEKGKIMPPQRYEYRSALGKESDFYGHHPDIYSAESDFISALEDWESQDWYKKLKAEK